MNSVLSLDLATTTGWALWKPGMSKPRASTIVMPEVEKDIGWWGEAFLEWLIPFSRLENVTEIVAEAPYIAIHHGPEGAKINANEIEKLVSLFGFAALGCRQLGLSPLVRAPRSTVCKHFIGQAPDKNHKRKWLKGACMVGCQRKGWNVSSQDIADALATLDWYTFDRKIEVTWDNKPAVAGLFEAPGVQMPTKAEQAASSKFLNKALSFTRDGGSL